MRYFIKIVLLGLSFSAFGQRQNYFVEFAPTATFGHVRNSLHYNHAGGSLKGGFSAGLGMAISLQKRSNWYFVLMAMFNQRQFELNRLQPYSSDPLSVTPLLRTTYGTEALLGIMRKVPLTPHRNVTLMAGLTQDIVGKQYQKTFVPLGPVRQSETFGVGSITLRNRAFVRAGMEWRVASKLALAIEGSFSAEIKPPFVATIDKLNPLVFGLHLRVIGVP